MCLKLNAKMMIMLRCRRELVFHGDKTSQYTTLIKLLEVRGMLLARLCQHCREVFLAYKVFNL